jgi:hypothetical protein
MTWKVMAALGTWTLFGCSGAAPAPKAASTPPAAPSVVAVPPAPAPASAPAPAPGPDVPVHWRGSRVTLAAPPAMQRPTRIPYLFLEEPRIVIAITEMSDAPERIDQLLEGTRRGAELVDEQPITRGSASGYLGHVKPQHGLARQVLVLRDGGAAALLMAQYAETAEPTVARVLASVQLDAKLPLEPLAVSGITLGDDAGFEALDVTSAPILLTDKGKRPPLAGVPTMALMSVQYPKPDITDEELGQLLGTFVVSKNPDMSKSQELGFELSGKPAFGVVAPATEPGGKQVVLFAFITRRPDSAFLGWGTAPLSAKAKAVPRFERLVKSLELDDAILAKTE